MKFDLTEIKKFSAIPTRFLEEKTMTLKAKGLLCHIYTLPNDWNYNMNGLCSITGTKITQLRTAIEELELFGYLKREQIRNEKGKIEYIYKVMIEPIPFSKRKCLSVKKLIAGSL